MIISTGFFYECPGGVCKAINISKSNAKKIVINAI